MPPRTDRGTEIAVLEKCRAELAQIQDLSTVLGIRDRAEAMRVYLRAQNEGQHTQNYAAHIVAVAGARAGELIKELKDKDQLSKGGRPATNPVITQVPNPTEPVPRSGNTVLPVTTLEDLGVTKMQSRRYQMAAEVLRTDPTWFETHRDTCNERNKSFTQGAVIRRARELNCHKVGKVVPEAPEGVYDVIVIDPPWPTTRPEFDVHSPTDVGFDYPTMTEGELELLDLPCAEDCHVWVWTTHRFLPMALRLVTGWGLDYSCTFVWVKSKGMQMPDLPYFNNEFALYCRRGSPEFKTTKGLKTAHEWPRGKHSEKPREFYDEVRRVTTGRRLDMFNRRVIDGFEAWGNEANKKPAG